MEGKPNLTIRGTQGKRQTRLSRFRVEKSIFGEQAILVDHVALRVNALG
jgi:hypothetical protein